MELLDAHRRNAPVGAAEIERDLRVVIPHLDPSMRDPMLKLLSLISVSKAN